MGVAESAVGSLMAASMAASQGWKVSYLGPNLPAEEIVAAAERVYAALGQPGGAQTLIEQLQQSAADHCKHRQCDQDLDQCETVLIHAAPSPQRT